MLKKSILSLAIISSLSACTLELDTKDDSENTANSQKLTFELAGRTVLNAESPEGAAEIVSFHKSTGHIYAINSSGDNATVEIIDGNNINPEALTKTAENVVTNSNLVILQTLDVSSDVTGDANSLAIDDNNHILAVAMAAQTTGEKGHIAFYDISGAAPQFIKSVEVGYLPDMVTFTHDGKKAVVANEGEPSGDYTIDPVGSVSVIEINAGIPSDTATDIQFDSLNNMQDSLMAQGVKFASPHATTLVSQDLEPEYVSITEDNQTAFVSLQENNAIAVINLQTNELTQVFGLGFKNWNNYKLDVSDKDDAINLQSYQHLYGMYQPDTIASYKVDGRNYVVTANEGDAREYIDSALSGGSVEDENKAACLEAHPNGLYDFDDDEEVCFSYLEESRIKDLEDIAPLSTDLEALVTANGGKDGLGRLIVTTALGYNQMDNQYEDFYSYGARSFSIFSQDGDLVFDSGDDFEMITAQKHGNQFNNNEDENEGDTRSDAKGPEPEALTLGKIGERTYAFIGLERMGGIFVYDITNPFESTFVDYFINRGLVEGEEITGDLAPEGMKFVSANDSPTGQALLIIGNEISGSVAVWEISVEQ
ncbi:choice-of-anchor I family protein [Catenovulum adriaticum]|uniref:Choice-of-anchor I family protein n=1 Tax=Catenovulum adriaticum TaxID=2984846 RepID=A0ABY7AQA3_9ALTE|nr:choice-of-anchor I family protein [Catenovulum sp. TS8]WAJ70932.1 choice-of-anchor I family protein [Catenovulum sp. TS8]